MPKILIVDDQVEVRELIQVTFEIGNYQILTAENGQQAIEIAQAEHPNIILLDIMMPGSDIDGLEACRRLKADPATADIFISMLSAKGQESDIFVGQDAGADDYFTKPFDPIALIEWCETLLATIEWDTPDSLNLLHKERKRLHRQCEELLTRIDKLEEKDGDKAATVTFNELGVLVSGVVHDLRGGLGIIRNTAGFMLDDLEQNSQLVADVHKIIHSADFCEVVIRNLTALGGGDAFEPTEVNLEALVRDVFFMLERKLVDVALIIDVDPDRSTIMADEGQMKQVFANLIKNAAEAMPEGGTLTIRTRCEEEKLRVEVADTGTGIPSENLDRIFDLYFTTKEKGFGVGLHVVKSIIERHGGMVDVTSRVDHGTTFILHLPIE